MGINKMKVCLDLHDFSIINSRLDTLFKIKEYFPGFKVSLFTVPLDRKEDWGRFLIRQDLLKTIKENLDWMQLIPHGLFHEGSEMKRCDYNQFKYDIMPRIKQAFDKDGLPFERGFVAPHWRWTEGVVKALDESGWWGAVDRRQPFMPKTKRFYVYSHCLDEPLVTDSGIMKIHGHIYGTPNDLGRCFDNLMTVPKDAEWHFVTDFIEKL